MNNPLCNKKKINLGVENIMQQVQTMHVFWSPDIYQKVDIAMPKETFEILVFQKQLIVAEDENHQILGIVSFEENGRIYQYGDTNKVKTSTDKISSLSQEMMFADRPQSYLFTIVSLTSSNQD